MKSSDSSHRLVAQTLLAAMAAIFLFLVFRNSGLGPSVLGDEWSYSLYSRLLPFSQARVPSFLYFLIYRSSNVCGVEFASCTRVLNAGFFVAATPFMFLIARRHMHLGLAMLLTLATLLSPLSTYTAFFMPEAMYFFMFWVLAWIVLVVAPYASVINGLLVGALLGAMCLVKFHAIFLLGGYCLYLLSMMLLTRGTRTFRVTMQGMAIAIAVFFSVRLGGGYLLAGSNGLHLLGSLYSAQVNGSFSHPDMKLLLHHGARSALGHSMAMVMLYAVPLACLFQLRHIPADNEQSSASDRQRLMIFSMAMLSVLVAVTVYFTANIPDGNPLQALQRLHMRYYSFALPLLYVGGGDWTKD
jgi:phosphoglycerol transferase